MTTVRGIYTGSFDPITNGHLDIIKRSFRFCNELIISIGINSNKKTLCSESDRLDMIKNSIPLVVPKNPNYFCKVVSFNGLLTDLALKEKANIIIRGVRSVTDFEYEMTLSQINKQLAPDIETIFIPTSPELAIVSSSMVKELARFGGDFSKFVPSCVEDCVKKQFGFIKFGDPEIKK